MKKWMIVSSMFAVIGGFVGMWALSMSSPLAVNAEGDPSPTPSSYGDLLDTEIRGIDADTIDGYRNGLGLGLALPAELNGYPGPRHVLDLADELELTEEQHDSIQQLFDAMQPEAIALGEQILVKEAELELAFREGTITENFLETQLTDIGDLESQLRFVHLRTHLSTIEILTTHQVAVYNQLRGYTSADSGHGNHHN